MKNELTIGKMTPSICNGLSVCTEATYLRYAVKIKEAKTMGAVIGIQVHHAIEEALKYQVNGEVFDIEKLKEQAKVGMLKCIDEEDVDIDGLYMPFEEQIKQMNYCIDGYLTSPEFKGLHPQGEFEEIEHYFKYFVKPIDGKLDIIDVPKPGYLPLSGKTDFLEWDEEKQYLKIIDYKTGSSRFPWDLLKVRKRIQFRVYAWILSKAFNVSSLDMSAHIINKSSGKSAKPVVVQEFITTFTEKDLADCERQLIGFYQIIQNNIHFYCDNCPGYCSYKNICGKHVKTEVQPIDDLDWVI